ncbi:MAG: branched-chain amino acid ABC transporter permease [Chloroflexota bacterium]
MDLTPFAQAVANGLLMGGLYALVAVGLTIIFGTMNLVNFAHGEFVMLGMFATYWLHHFTRLDPLLLIFAVMPLMFLFGAIIQRTVIQRVVAEPHETQILLTLGVSVLLMNGALLLWGPEPRAVPTVYSFAALSLGSVLIPLPRLIAFLVALLLAALLWAFLTRTDMGRALRATSENRDWAVLMGIDPVKMYVLAFGIGIALAAAAGALMTPFFNTFPRAGVFFGTIAFVVVVLGGMGNIPGAVLGALVIGVTESLTGQFVALDLSMFGVFVIFLLVLIFKPTGIIGGGRLY